MTKFISGQEPEFRFAARRCVMLENVELLLFRIQVVAGVYRE